MAEIAAVSDTAAAVAKVKQMEQKAADSREQTRTQIVGIIESHIAELGELGFRYRLVDEAENGKPTKKCAHCGGEDHSTRSCPNKKA